MLGPSVLSYEGNGITYGPEYPNGEAKWSRNSDLRVTGTVDLWFPREIVEDNGFENRIFVGDGGDGQHGWFDVYRVEYFADGSDDQFKYLGRLYFRAADQTHVQIQFEAARAWTMNGYIYAGEVIANGVRCVLPELRNSPMDQCRLSYAETVELINGYRAYWVDVLTGCLGWPVERAQQFADDLTVDRVPVVLHEAAGSWIVDFFIQKYAGELTKESIDELRDELITAIDPDDTYNFSVPPDCSAITARVEEVLRRSKRSKR